MKPSVLYVAYWGAAEPLGQSLIVPAVERLAVAVDLTLITFEKPRDLGNREEMARVRRRFESAGIRWIPLRYHKRPKLPATAFDLLHGIVAGLRAAIGKRPAIVHARTFPGGLIGMVLAKLLGAKFLYHNEGFYPDEQVDGGVWAAGSFAHRVARRLETMMYDRADAIVCMSRRSKAVLESMDNLREKRTPVVVVPSCVDLEHFRRSAAEKRPSDGMRFIYIGSVGLRYIVDKLARFVAVAREVFPGLQLRVLTPANREFVAGMLRAGGLADDEWTLDTVPHSAIPDELRAADAGLFFLQKGISEFGCSPTKIGEYWASGIPVVTTAGVSDTDDIIAARRVGVVIGEHSDDAYRTAAHQLKTLLEDRDLGERCRQAAESFYALAPFCDAQLELYSRLAASR